MRLQDLYIDSISDQNVREVLRRMIDVLKSIPWLSQWQLIEVSASGAVTGATQSHHLGFQPQDALLLSTTGAGSVTLNISKFTNTSISYTTTGAVTFRAIIGTARGD